MAITLNKCGDDYYLLVDLPSSPHQFLHKVQSTPALLTDTLGSVITDERGIDWYETPMWTYAENIQTEYICNIPETTAEAYLLLPEVRMMIVKLIKGKTNVT